MKPATRLKRRRPSQIKGGETAAKPAKKSSDKRKNINAGVKSGQTLLVQFTKLIKKSLAKSINLDRN